MKQCNTCNVDLVVGDNWLASALNNADYKCRSCKNAMLITYNKKYNSTARGRKVKEDAMKRYMSNDDNYKKQRKNIKKKNYSIPAGIYGVFSDCKLIYIGESSTPYRRKGHHFTIEGIRGGKTTQSSISKALGNKELQRDNLVFKMLKYIDDTKARQAQEKRLIQRYRPLYNDLYV